MRQLKLLPGTMLIVLASTFSINPVSAQQTPASGTGETQNQMDRNNLQTPTRTNTQPVPTPMQMEGQSTPSSTPIQRERQAVPSSTEPTNNTVSGTIKSIEGGVVTLTMADGMTKEMKVSSADIQRLNLREGMEISATVDAQSMASNITLAQANPSTTNSETPTSPVGGTSTTTETPTSQVGGTSTTTEATTSQVGGTSTTTEATTTTPTQADVNSEPATTTENTSTTTESAPANRPVRALW